MKNVNLDKLNEHLFETMEMLKNNTDPKASENEKIDVETAKTIANLGKVVVEGYKVKAQVLNTVTKGGEYSNSEAKKIAIDMGINKKED